MKQIFSSLLILLFFGCSSFSGKEDYRSLRELNQETLVPTRWDVGNTTVSNEDRLDVLIPYVQNVGNVYVGVGSEQNLTIAAWAKSEFVYLMDFTRVVVSANEIMVLFLKESDTKEKFLSLYKKERENEAISLIEKNFSNPQSYVGVYKKIIRYIRKRHKTNLKTAELYHYKMFQTDDSQYEYIHNLAKADRIYPVKGNLLGKVTLKSIGDTLRKNGQKLGVIYFSNAEEYFYYPQTFKESIQNFPITDSSIVVRTLSVKKHLFPWSPGSDISTDFGFHYCIQPISNFQAWLALDRPKLRSDHIMEEGGKTDRSLGITVVSRLPGRKSL
ncbi:LIC_10091 family lipoprotein [Leptospira idonii]|uniref:DUF7790 domain-containing protein n=1 Tax=Leptospira idonii TaxID=1193500 RepID=A0A4R9LXD8_9LEPT|nr:hypothetical protein EHS15_11210 [Leptospira idonii]